ncbi:MAG: hypothetical protein PHQ40_04520 [Anaerolineaceae bacterium]|nr:hypothetical protein [Anaerolineaceae bacterium]
MNKPEIDPTLAFDQQLKAWYDYLDAFINAEEKIKTNLDLPAWVTGVNQTILEPIGALFKMKFENQLPVKIQFLDTNPKVKKDDHLKRLKANRYNIFNYQRAAYLEQMGDL